MNNKIKVVSLFDGIACGRISMEELGIDVSQYFAYEIDKYAINVANKNYPDIVHLGSVVGADFSIFKDKNIDLVMGGSPCQNLSICGDRTGLEGEQSKLFYEFVRAVKEINPKYFLLENNASMSAENKEAITQIMGVEPIEINSSKFSAQNRRRLYWTNITVAPITEQVNGKYVKDIVEETHKDYVNYFEETMFNTKIQNDYTDKPLKIGQVRKGRQGERVYSIKGKSINLTANGGGVGSNTGLYKINDYTVRKLSPIECERLQTIPDNYTEGISNSQRYKCIGNGWTVSVISHILSGLLETQ